MVLLTFAMIASTTTAATVVVDSTGNGDYSSIQEAIDNAAPDDLIIVNEGQYIETVVVDKELSITSDSASPETTIVQADAVDENVFLVRANNVTINGFEILGVSSVGGCGISLDRVSGCSIKNNVISNNFRGIYLQDSNNNTISHNTCMENGRSGIFLVESSDNILDHNGASNQLEGIVLGSSDDNVLEGNIAGSNNESGILLRENCKNNQLHNNSMIANRYDFGDDGKGNIIDQSNLVNGKPIYYLNSLSDIVIDGSSNAGTLYCYDCRNITIKNLVLKNNKYGIYLSGTEESYLYNITSSGNYNGIYLTNSEINMATDCIISDNTFSGVFLEESEENLIENNQILANKYGVHFHVSGDNMLSSNLISKNLVGIELVFSDNNMIKGNTVSKNEGGIFLYKCNGNEITGDNISSNADYGIFLRYSDDNLFVNNKISSSIVGFRLADYSYNNTVNNNSFSEAYIGITGNESENMVANNSLKNSLVPSVSSINSVQLLTIILIVFGILRNKHGE
ncbi:NosD domain-containing protein [Methanolobus sp. ZRKC2]|uniref:NosD domain-containing protein n=1 Tax=Methanolobus sp. ZRKC2 TaxID=3125783 RepID=UPI00324C568D